MNKSLPQKVLHISPTDIRYDSRILKELKALESLDEIDVMAFGIDDTEGHKYKTEYLTYVRTFKLLSKKASFLPRPLRYFINLVEAMFKLTVPAIKYRPQIIHCHDTLYLPIALIVKWFCKAKLIYDAHELESDKAGQSKLLSKYTLFIEKIAWRKIDLLISVSPSIIAWYQKKFGQKESLLVLNSPILNNDEKFERNNYLRDKFKIPFDKRIFLYLGIINSEGRGIDLYLDVFKKNDINSHVVFIGYGEYVDEIKKAALEYSNIHYHPAVAHHQVVEISSSADVGLCMVEAVSLSDYYCLPNKLFEYAFSGLFVIASDFPDIKELVDTYSLGKCSSLDKEEIYKVVKEIETVNISKNIENLYPLSWEFQAEQLLEAYKKQLTIKN